MNGQNIKRYAAYKDSGVDEWLGEVPAHWNLERIKNLTKTQSGTTPRSGLSEYYDNGTNYWVRTTDLNNGRLYDSEYKVTDLALKDYGLKTIPVNSVLLAMYGGMGTIGKNAILQNDVTINQSVCAILPHEKRFNSTYLWYYVQYFRPIWEMFADSARKDPNINQEAIKRLWVILPSLFEQQAIATYLDTKTAQIDRQIDLLCQKAAQYGKLKQSLINETVTRGLDKTVAMKDSGVEWIGEVPSHWEIKRFKEIFSKTHSGWTPDTSKRESFEGENIWVTIRDMDGGIHIEESANKLSDKAIAEAGISITPKGSLLFSFKLSIGKIAFAGCDLYTNEAIISIEDEPKINLNYFFYTLPFFLVLNAKENIYGAKLLNQGLIFNTSLLLPPKAEQVKIANYLDEKTAHIDRIVSTINTQIDKLKELRLTLINDIVTGKIKITNEVVYP